ncbi:DUF6519 domain-containing protein [Sinorhizobium sp. BG8]|uniref:DUF6519 domain-containing protein n=1 Tax=Sinorhizobium sp. BG8 TaxID=2613773 RepID=UPI00193D1007|nr:DUF6519 domain-containing protein [Sinorhizobium sp. BG8]QRM54366.1 hypothetical protein F3Y30_07250 [Sinorhizobium sp. BG8]
MSGDYSRFTHDARKRFTSLLTQQGRVQLDSDWNEAADIERERLRTQALDTFGPVGVPYATTPDGFKITAPVANDFSVGDGRIYVDGRLAEIFPGENVTYQSQPFLPDPPAIGGTNYNVYLDLWEREITYIEDNDLLDKALGGVDTATRIQQVWQVRTQLTAQGPAACGTPFGTPASGGRMSVAAIAPPAPEDPCIVPPLTGYRGLENRLYRVEIQTPGPLGTATFTWSRDNASLVTSIGEITTTAGKSSVRVGRIGRDRVARFAIGDWVTVTDDHRELHGEAGNMARIDDIDEANAILKLDRALGATGRPFATAPSDLLARHTRVQRWDQSSSDPLVGADGTILTAAGPIAIEEGIEVSFSTVGAEGFHVGDYWLFAARTADASVEEFTDAPPRGIIHAYAQLAAVNGPNVSDCRPQPVTSEGCCTFVLNPGEDIQQAIDQLPPSGGCVCLKTGVHPLRAPLFIAKNDVSLHGESTGAILEIGEGPLLTVSGRRHRIHELQFRRQRGGPAMVSFVRAQDCIFDDCTVSGGGSEDGGIAISIVESQRIDIARSTVSGTDVNIHIAGGRTRLATVTDCFLAGSRSENSEEGGAPGTAGILLQGRGGDFGRIENCVIGGVANGIVCLEKEADLAVEGLSIIGNRIECVAFRQVLSERNMGVGVMVDGGMVGGNAVTMERMPEFAPVTAIAVGGAGLRVEDNEAGITSPRGSGPPSIGIHVGWNGEQGNLLTTDGVVAHNLIRDAEVGLFAEAPQASVVAGNAVHYEPQERAALTVGLLVLSSRGGRYDDNRITGMTFGIAAALGDGNSFERNVIERGQVGIGTGRETGCSLMGNVIGAQERFGVLGFDCRGRMSVHDNRVSRTGTTTNEFPKVGVFLLGVTGQASVERNEIVDTGFDADFNVSPGSALGIAVILSLEAAVRDNIVNYSGGWDGIVEKRGFGVEDRSLLMQGMSLPSIIPTDGVTGYPALVQGNRFEGMGFSALVQFLERDRNDPLLRFERVSFANNDCMHRSPRDTDTAVTLLLKGRHALVSANAFRAFPGQPACVDFQQITRPVFVGNYFVRAPMSPAPIPAAMLATNIDL